MRSTLTVTIHPTAIVEEGVELESDVIIGPYCVVRGPVTIGRGTVLRSHVVIQGPVMLGEANEVYPFVTLGLEPQDVKYGGEDTRVRIGDHNIIREYVSIHRGTLKGRGETRVGSHNFIMAYAHIAHDCIIGDHVVLTNAASLAGHCVVEDHAVIAAFSGVHQFCRIGKYSFIGAFSAIPQDVAPFVHVVGNRARVYGVNTVGLKRAGFSAERIDRIRKAVRILFHSRLPIPDALEKVRSQFPDDPDINDLCRFVETSERGVVQ